AGAFPPPLPAPAAVAVFAGDHGVVAQGVTPWPQEVTAQMVSTFLGGGAAINVLARQAGARVAVIDVGGATPLPDDPALTGGPVRSIPATPSASWPRWEGWRSPPWPASWWAGPPPGCP